MTTTMTTFSTVLARLNSHVLAGYSGGMAAGKSGVVAVGELDRLRIELRDSAAELDRCGRHDASDLAAILAARLDELIARASGEGGAVS